MISLLSGFSKLKFVVIGDVMLDRYLWGDVERISPEAPVPVIKISKETDVLGGAANVAANLAALSCHVTLVGAIGDDTYGTRLSDLVTEKKIKPLFIKESGFTTITKTRIMATTQQLLRIDHEKAETDISNDIAQIKEALRSAIDQADAVILSDYNKGFLKSEPFCKTIIEQCKKQKKSVYVDSKDTSWDKFHGVTVITPNDKELLSISESYQIKEIKPEDTARRLCEKLNINTILVTNFLRKHHNL